LEIKKLVTVIMENKLQDKYASLVKAIQAMGRVCVAYSGGVDSALLLKVCADTLGSEQVLAITAISASYPEADKATAAAIACRLGVPHILLETEETSDAEFIRNSPDRCYHCKRHFLMKLLDIARARGFACVCDGSNADDELDYRPGKRASAEFGVLSPLADAGLGKDEVRALSRELGLAGWDRPASPCLASRIPYGSPITHEKLRAVAQAEDFLRTLGFGIVRVRHHGNLARIEVSKEDIPRLIDESTAAAIVRHLKGLGFTWVCADLEGYRTGSLNEALSAEQKRR